MQSFSRLALLASPIAAQVYCPTGQGLYHTTHLVQSGLDDVEEAHAGPIQGFLYQGSSDLELGNHVEITNDTPQYVGIRFQGVDIPAGASIKDAHIKFSVDESTNYGTHGEDFTGESLHLGDWSADLTVRIKARKVANAGAWLDPDSENEGIASNRDCPAASGCMNNYDCNSIALLGPHWGISMQENAACTYFEDGSFAARPAEDLIASGTDQWGDEFESWLSHESDCVDACEANNDANSNAFSTCVNDCPLQKQCSCGGCLCGQHPVGAGVLANVWNDESTTAEATWQPYGENIAKSQTSERRPTALTPDLSNLIQEVVDLDGWASGNSLAFVIDGVTDHDADGTASTAAIPVRTYESYDGSNTAEHAWTHQNSEYGPTLFISYCAPVVCAADHTFHSETLRVESAADDVEENQEGNGRTSAGFLYQGSSDLEIGNDPETGGAQYVGLRFQNVPIPQGAVISAASLMLTIDESFNSDEECNEGDDNYAECRRFAEWITAEIKMRKVSDAPEWLAGNDADVVANRDCSLDTSTGLIDSGCMPGDAAC